MGFRFSSDLKGCHRWNSGQTVGVENHSAMQTTTAGSVFCDENGCIVANRDNRVRVCRRIPPFDFLQNLHRRLPDSRAIASATVPVCEPVWFGD